MKNFYEFLANNNAWNKSLEMNVKDSIYSILENECKKILDIIKLNPKETEEVELFPIYISDGIYAYAPTIISEKHFPDFYYKTQELYLLSQKIQKRKNVNKVNRISRRIMFIINQLLEKNK
ncbi:MAG: hypothetical protein WC868_03640 [Bacteroidales bacterium]